jgi:hypothetical protein
MPATATTLAARTRSPSQVAPDLLARVAERNLFSSMASQIGSRITLSRLPFVLLHIHP